MSIIIECRNKDGSPIISNGDWTTTLGQTIEIFNQDQVFIKNTFIDTQQSSNEKININEDLLVEFQFGCYYKYNPNAVGIDAYAGGAVAVNYEDYIVCVRKAIPSPDPNNLQFVPHIYLESADGINPTKEIPNLIIYWTDFDGNNQQKKVLAPEFPAGAIQYPLEIQNIISQGSPTTNLSPEDLAVNFNAKITIIESALEGKNVCLPYTTKKAFNIPKGNYDPDKLCEIINNSITFNDPANKNPQGYPVEPDGILQTAKQIMLKNNLIANELVLIPTDGDMTKALQYDASKNYPAGVDVYVGTNQFEISYNSGTRSFEFNYLHFPFYYQSNLAVAIGETGGSTYTINKLGGIWIEALYAEEVATGSIVDFWGLLGFSQQQTPELRPEFTFTEVSADPLDGSKPIIVPNTQLIERVNITGGLLSVDKAVDKGNPMLPFNNNPIYSTLSINDTESISAGISVLDNTDSFGYYIIDIGSQFKNNYYTPTNNYRNFQQIVSRYYVNNSYTNGSSDGSLIYTHTGDPMLIENFRCRILNSDKQVAKNIGDDNTIHIAIVRANPLPKSLIPPKIKEADKSDETKK